MQTCCALNVYIGSYMRGKNSQQILSCCMLLYIAGNRSKIKETTGEKMVNIILPEGRHELYVRVSSELGEKEWYEIPQNITVSNQ